jgi:hypothetical protein
MTGVGIKFYLHEKVGKMLKGTCELIRLVFGDAAVS